MLIDQIQKYKILKDKATKAGREKPNKAKAGGQNTGHDTEIHNCKNSTNQGGHVEVQELTEVDTSRVQDRGTGGTHRKQRRVRGKTKKRPK